MTSDPFYEKILAGLAGHVDPELFEQYATELLRSEYPTLVQVCGGSDDGMDGIASDGTILVCTTAKDVIGNLSKNLARAVERGRIKREVIVACTQSLTQLRRKNLEDRAVERGFSLRQIYDRKAMASRLYAAPRLCKALLGLTGRPSALAAIPRGTRPVPSEVLVGREDAREWLLTTTGDRLVLGQPACGKTFLLRSLVLDGWGLFVADGDREQLANSVREREPSIIIVDDGFNNGEFLGELVQLRQQIDAEFDIVAVGWEGDKDVLATTLGLSQSKILTLELLNRDQIVEVVKNAGVPGPPQLVRLLVDEAQGHPGLAVTLAYLCRQGDVDRVANGEALRSELLARFGEGVGPNLGSILGSFALGGDAGMPLDKVAQSLELPVSDANHVVRQLAAGGVVRPVGDGNISVWPERLRVALVRDTFFADSGSLNFRRLLSEAPSRADAMLTLVSVNASGVGIDGLRPLLEEARDIRGSEAYAVYASIGFAQAEWVLSSFPERLRDIADNSLLTAPKLTIPQLLSTAEGAEAVRYVGGPWPIETLERWLNRMDPWVTDAAARRQLLVAEAINWMDGGGATSIGQRALFMALSPTFSHMRSDPGGGHKCTLTSGLLGVEQLRAVAGLWSDVLDYMTNANEVDWNSFFQVVRSWVYPGHHGCDIPDELAAEMRTAAVTMLLDTIREFGSHSGVQQEAEKLARAAGAEATGAVDTSFCVLFPEEDLENWRETESTQRKAVDVLAEQWLAEEPKDVAQKLVTAQRQARDVGKMWPDWTSCLCRVLAKRVSPKLPWATAFRSENVTPGLLEPFLRSACEDGEPGCTELLSELLTDSTHRAIACSVILSATTVPDALLEQCLEQLGSVDSNILEVLIIRGEVPEKTLIRLLEHPESAVASVAAVAEWRDDRDRHVRDGVLEPWRSAIVRSDADEYWLSQILASDPSLAYDWLSNVLTRDGSRMLGRGFDGALEAAAAALTTERRIQLIALLKDDWHHKDMAKQLVRGNPEAYRALLQREELETIHLNLLAGHPTAEWKDMAAEALAAGKSPEDIADQMFYGGMSWAGRESDMWEGWVAELEPLTHSEHPGVAAVAKAASAKAQRNVEQCKEEEAAADVYGRGAVKRRSRH